MEGLVEHDQETTAKANKMTQKERVSEQLRRHFDVKDDSQGIVISGEIKVKEADSELSKETKIAVESTDSHA
jgi:hypothetical protein